MHSPSAQIGATRKFFSPVDPIPSLEAVLPSILTPKVEHAFWEEGCDAPAGLVLVYSATVQARIDDEHPASYRLLYSCFTCMCGVFVFHRASATQGSKNQ